MEICSCKKEKKCIFFGGKKSFHSLKYRRLLVTGCASIFSEISSPAVTRMKNRLIMVASFFFNQHSGGSTVRTSPPLPPSASSSPSSGDSGSVRSGISNRLKVGPVPVGDDVPSGSTFGLAVLVNRYARHLKKAQKMFSECRSAFFFVKKEKRMFFFSRLNALRRFSLAGKIACHS